MEQADDSQTHSAAGDKLENLTPFIALSVDVCGSTQIKFALDEFAATHQIDRVRGYAAFGEALTVTERRLLDRIAENSGPTTIDRLFLIKAIGDEWFYSYDVAGLDTFQIGAHGTHLLSKLLAFLSTDPACVILSDVPDDDPYVIAEPNAVFREDLHLKVTLDLVHGHDFGEYRAERLKQTLAGFVGTSLVRAGDARYVELLQRLSPTPAIVNSTEGKVTLMRRSDYIGLEVDRFFRLTGKSRIGEVLVGANLARLLHVTSLDSDRAADAEEFREVMLQARRARDTGFTTLGQALAKIEAWTDLKGVGAYGGTYFKDRFSAYKRDQIAATHRALAIVAN